MMFPDCPAYLDAEPVPDASFAALEEVRFAREQS
jgi:hypothetical protein